jgi:predicted membrane channel-forming protein YqfA (hemolysin III family)
MFLLPAIYEYYNKDYGLSIITCITSLCSMNYWRNTKNYWRLQLDKTIASASSVIYLLHGYYYITDEDLRKIGYFHAGALLFFYAYSEILYARGYSKWVYSHVVFHFFTITGKLLVLHSINKKRL